MVLVTLKLSPNFHFEYRRTSKRQKMGYNLFQNMLLIHLIYQA